MAATPPKQHKKKVENDAYRGQPRVQLKEANKTITKLAATAATLDSDFLRKILHEKFRTKINTPCARENVRCMGVMALVQHKT